VNHKPKTVPQSDTADFDVLIIGGGMAGASLACALGNSGLQVAVVEQFPLRSASQPSYDDRTVALAYGSKRIFAAMGVWDAIVERGASPIEHIHISDRGHFGFTRLHASQAGVEALGYVVENRTLGEALLDAMAGYPAVTLLCPAAMQHIDVDDDVARVTIRLENAQRTLTSRLVVVADGGRSGAREMLGIPTREVPYGQTAVVANVTPARCHGQVAYERFTPTGPLALLPMTENRCALVWSVAPEEVDGLLALADDVFLARLQERFGERLGAFVKVGRRNAYPLTLTRVGEHVRKRLALIGNAAHTLHPVAGQGFNLGLRDVAVLAQVLRDAVAFERDPGDLGVLRRYADWRRRDNFAVSTFTDMLVRTFSNSFPPLAAARNLGLMAVDVCPPLKQALVRRTMGLAGRLPRLARGLAE
jgi:2-octaprenyl-6-methoxyphenol hydroxylase